MPGTRVIIDTRPLWLILLSRGRPFFLLLIGAALYWWVIGLETPAGLGEPGQKALAVFVLCIFYLVFDVLPLMITSLLAIVLLPLTGVLPSKTAYAQFGNEAVFFILGAFIIAAAMMKSGLSARIALMMLRRFGHDQVTMLRGIFVLNGIMSFFMSEHAVAAMTFPIILKIVSTLRLPREQSTYGRALFLSTAWGTTIGGVATLLGGARAPLALGMLREVTGTTYSFAEWAAANVPLSVLLFVALVEEGDPGQVCSRIVPTHHIASAVLAVERRSWLARFLSRSAKVKLPAVPGCEVNVVEEAQPEKAER